MWTNYNDLAEKDKNLYIESRFEELLIDITGMTSHRKPFKDLDITGFGWHRENGVFELYEKHPFNFLPVDLGDESYEEQVKKLGDFKLILGIKNKKFIIEKTVSLESLKTESVEQQKMKIEQLELFYEKTGNQGMLKKVKMKTLFGITEQTLEWLDETIADIDIISADKKEKLIKSVEKAKEMSKREIQKSWENETFQKMIKDHLKRENTGIARTRIIKPKPIQQYG